MITTHSSSHDAVSSHHSFLSLSLAACLSLSLSLSRCLSAALLHERMGDVGMIVGPAFTFVDGSM